MSFWLEFLVTAIVLRRLYRPLTLFLQNSYFWLLVNKTTNSPSLPDTRTNATLQCDSIRHPQLNAWQTRSPYSIAAWGCNARSKRYCGQISLHDGILYRDHHYPKKIGVNGCGISAVYLFCLAAIESHKALLEEVFCSCHIFVTSGILCTNAKCVRQ
jgi:hypothetical protein